MAAHSGVVGGGVGSDVAVVEDLDGDFPFEETINSS